VKTPKPAGLKRGWLQTYVVVVDFKLFFYDCQMDKHNKTAVIEPAIRQVISFIYSISTSILGVRHARRRFSSWHGQRGRCNSCFEKRFAQDFQSHVSIKLL
jgi:hypothetical protein